MRGVFLGDDGGPRPIWRAVFFVPAAVAAVQLLSVALNAVLGPPPPGPLPFDPLDLSLAEGVNLAAALSVTGSSPWGERRRIDSYGLPIGRALTPPTFRRLPRRRRPGRGGRPGHVCARRDADPGFRPDRTRHRDLRPRLARHLVPDREEYLFRGYLPQSLWKAIGFWSASIVIAALFAGVHYLLKPGETLADLIALVSFSLLCCYSVRRAGDLWFAVGLHVAYDFMQLFVIGTRNGGRTAHRGELQRSGLAHRRGPRHGGELARLAPRRPGLRLRLVAVPQGAVAWPTPVAWASPPASARERRRKRMASMASAQVSSTSGGKSGTKGGDSKPVSCRAPRRLGTGSSVAAIRPRCHSSAPGLLVQGDNEPHRTTWLVRGRRGGSRRL